MELPGYDELKKRCMEAAPEGVDTREGSLIDTAVGPVCAELASAYLTLQSFYDLLFPDTSAGAYLDRIAAQYGISRGVASPAVLEAEFFDNPLVFCGYFIIFIFNLSALESRKGSLLDRMPLLSISQPDLVSMRKWFSFSSNCA